MDTISDDLLAVLNFSPDAMFVVDPSGNMVDVNAAAAELFGYAPRELIGKPVEVLVPDRLQPFHQHGHDAFLTRPSRQQWPSGTRVRALTKAGREIPVEVTLGPLGKGDNVNVIASVRDVSARVAREDQLRAIIEETERRLRTSELDFHRTNDHFKLFLKHAPAAIALLDRQMRYLIVSDRWMRDFGRGNRDCHGLNHYDLFPDVPELWREEHRRCLVGETVVSDEDCFARRDGQSEWVRRELHPWRGSDGRVGGMLMFVELITARKNAELALMKSNLELEQRVAERTAELERLKNDATRANTQKSWFVAAASHDLRQPLQASLAYLSVLSRRTERDDLEELCAKARQPLKAMSDILDVLLDIADLESGNVQPQMCDFQLGDLLLRVIANAQNLAEDKGLRLSCVPTDLTVHSDPRLLERVLSNFVTNAIRYTDKGLIGVYCETVGDKVCISVTDTGIGIPPEALSVIFEDHIQLGNPERDRRKGLGLGLSIAKRIADALGHRISVQSELGSGSSFSIELPQSGAAAERIEAEEIAAPAPSSERPVVLLIDDDPDVAEAMQMLLQSYQFETYMAHSRDAALAMLESGLNPGLVLCDYRMPGANGIDVIRQVRQALGAEVPAVIMTGDMGLTECPDNLPKCAVLHKPMDVEDLFSIIGKLAA
jgi:PAS domain S-box-containing protein